LNVSDCARRGKRQRRVLPQLPTVPMQTPESLPAVTPAAAPSWRGIVLWLVFAATLVTGLVLALRFGGSVPVLYDGGPR
jgi:hypothetical protein